jgi:hypothetical protein
LAPKHAGHPWPLFAPSSRRSGPQFAICN